LELKDKLVT